MTDEERYLFDLQGFITIPDALNREELAEINAVMDAKTAVQPKAGEKVPTFVGMLSWGPLFRRLIDNPRIMPYLEELVHPQVRLDHDYFTVIRAQEGKVNARLHGGATPFDSGQYFHAQNNRMYNGLTVIAYNLYDVNPGDGGFACIPGSHKSNYPIPEAWKDLNDPAPVVRAVTGPAGTAVMFTEALAHGTLPWLGKKDRRTLFYKYSPPMIAWGANFYDHTQYSDLTERQKAMLEPPNARYPGRLKK